jgi:nucleotide-binding universal stress UspA family protein
MKILLAVDGSGPSHIAADLVASADWPIGSVIHVLVVDESEHNLSGAPWLGEPVFARPEPSWPHTQQLWKLADGTAALVAGRGATERSVVKGVAVPTIVAVARRWQADLVVLGSRGHGAVGSAFLGSVSAGVVDNAPCPVLVARKPSVGAIVIGVDGEAPAAAALDYLIAQPIFPTAPVTVVGAQRVEIPASAFAMGGIPVAAVDVVDETAHVVATAVDEAVGRLHAAGRAARPWVADGAPSVVLIDAARASGAELIVVGTHGHRGVERVLLGSVARSVLFESHGSVLVVRGDVGPVASEERRASLSASG